MSEDECIVKTSLPLLTRPLHLLTEEWKGGTLVDGNLSGYYVIGSYAAGHGESQAQDTTAKGWGYDWGNFGPEFTNYSRMRDYIVSSTMSDVDQYFNMISGAVQDHISAAVYDYRDMVEGIHIYPGCRNLIWNVDGFFGKVAPDGELLGMPPPFVPGTVMGTVGLSQRINRTTGFNSNGWVVMLNSNSTDANVLTKFNREYSNYSFGMPHWTGEILLATDMIGYIDERPWRETWRDPERPRSADEYLDFMAIAPYRRFAAPRKNKARWLTSIRQTPVVELSGVHDDRADMLIKLGTVNNTQLQYTDGMSWNSYAYEGMRFIADGTDDWGYYWQPDVRNRGSRPGKMKFMPMFNPWKIMAEYQCDGFYGGYITLNDYFNTYDPSIPGDSIQEGFIIPSTEYSTSEYFKPRIHYRVTLTGEEEYYHGDWVQKSFDKIYIGDTYLLGRSRTTSNRSENPQWVKIYSRY